MVDTSRINNTLGKMHYYLSQFNCVCRCRVVVIQT